MDVFPSLAPDDADHILSSTSLIQQADYKGHLKKFYGLNFETADTNKVILFYRTYDMKGDERIRLRQKPGAGATSTCLRSSDEPARQISQR